MSELEQGIIIGYAIKELENWGKKLYKENMDFDTEILSMAKRLINEFNTAEYSHYKYFTEFVYDRLKEIFEERIAINFEYIGGGDDFITYEASGDLNGLIEVQFDKNQDDIYEFSNVFKQNENKRHDDWEQITEDNPFYNTIKNQAIKDFNS